MSESNQVGTMGPPGPTGPMGPPGVAVSSGLELRVENLEADIKQIRAMLEKPVAQQVPETEANAADELARVKLNVHKIMTRIFGPNEANIAQPVVPPTKTTG
jgi:hypothetical protein